MVGAAVVAGMAATLLIQANTASAGDDVAVCFVPRGATVEQDRQVPAGKVDRLLRETRSYLGPCALYGDTVTIGGGRITAYTQATKRDVPVSIGMVIPLATLGTLPPEPPNDGSTCFDKNADGTVDPHTECAGGHSAPLRPHPRFLSTVDTRFTFLTINWNPSGHIPIGVYNVPHFDAHFYLVPDAERLAIDPGPCPQLVACDDYEVAKRPAAERYVAPGHVDVDAVEPRMGNHLINTSGPEFTGQPFTHTFIYGLNDARIMFYEPMITLAWLQGLVSGTTADGCVRPAQPAAWQRSGWYPLTYCMRYRENRNEITVSLENFVYRRAG
ncbi:hypothetical protein Val02_12940 [Virgisporangium aliadipatigenens]|uniref:DUF5602 domain-containing protein n=1 Tax=Virgisporangium aliadipatigenens TaxID=741659 RepID=A0A8J3YI73_9ACTN|nr:hypothetical protein Val02_12940 [Virgisporangium aliadipatigenens]